MLASISGGMLVGVPPAKRAKPLPRVGEFVRLVDPTTETPVVRLTSLASNSFFPASTNQFVSAKDRFLIFSSDRSGQLAPFHLDLHSGAVAQLAKPGNLIAASLCLNQRRTALYFLDGDKLQEITLANRKTRTLADGVSAFSELSEETHSTKTGDPSFVMVKNQRLEFLNRDGDCLADNVESFCLARPGGRGCFFPRRAGADDEEFCYVPFGPAEPATPKVIAKGAVTNPVWTPDGQALLFLRQVPRPNVTASEIHSANPETGTEQRVAMTSQYAAFSPNGDGSVFVGASASKAQPTILLLLADVQRELTLCEHRASRPAAALPVFSPDSKRVYFQSDHEGRSALYSVNVELLVEPTPASG